jgi:hypothetical protein
MIPAFGLSLVFSVALCVHAVRTGQSMYWLMIILLLQPLGGLVYLIAIVLPGVAGGPAARRLGQGARAALDPTREYREARAACDDTPTVHNLMRLAKAAAAQGRHKEAEQLYGRAATGIHADDPALLLGRAQSLLELGRHAEALALLETVRPWPWRSAAPTRDWGEPPRPTAITNGRRAVCPGWRAWPGTRPFSPTADEPRKPPRT